MSMTPHRHPPRLRVLHGETAEASPHAPAPQEAVPEEAAPPRHRAHDERLAAGKAHREALPRARHAAWKKPQDRADPVALLRAQDADRMEELVPIRYGRMMESPFAFYRGAAAVMAADLARTPATGHRVQACGDCHLMNFGGFATPERNVIFDINDFDETLPAPWEWDVKRLATSFVLAARALGLSDRVGRDAAETAARSYRKALRRLARMNPLEVWYAKLTAEELVATLPAGRRTLAEARIEAALERTGSEMDFPKLAGVVGGRATIRDTPPLIFHPEASRRPDFEAVLDQALAEYRTTLSDDRRTLLDRYAVVDAAIKVVGIGSVGRRCWIVLLMSAGNDPLFLQFKEATASVLEPHAGPSLYAHHGQRVVNGQRLMQPVADILLGWVTVQASGRSFYVRQLRDAKIKPLIETFDAELLTIYARACGAVLGRAHAKGAEVGEIAGYLGSGPRFDEAIGAFALAYADQTERDHAALKAAIRRGEITAWREAG
jgi:uncharacterized protein (DUF2252 family)